MCFHECMPPQQISPSAASRSPSPFAIFPASRNVFAISFVLAFGSVSQSFTDAALSIRTMPYGLASVIYALAFLTFYAYFSRVESARTLAAESAA